jgi:hypothetical protein
VFARPDFAVACANRDLGSVLRLAKRWGGVGFSASHLARRCGLTVSRVQDYVSGRIQAQQVGVFERVADGLHIPGVMFDLGPRPWEEVPAAQESVIAQPGARGGHRLISIDFLWTSERADARYLEAVRTSIDELISLDNRSGGTEISSLSENSFQAVHAQVGARSWCAVESTIEELTPLAESVSSTRTDLVVRNALANLRRPESCAPRNLSERGEILGHTLARSPV